jgi:uncharacterized protein with FMN-binding domain
VNRPHPRGVHRILVAAGGTLAGIALLFSYPTSTDQKLVSSGPLTPPATDPSTTSGPAPSGAATSPAPSGTGTTGTTGTATTFDGAAVDTAYGPVQVQITVSGGRITAARVLQVPQESGHDVRINSQAVPTLDQEAVQAQSAQIDSVSGASYTSEGYTRSLQSAIDAAHL